MRPIAPEADFSSDAGATSRSLGSSKLDPGELHRRRRMLARNAAIAYLSYDRSVSQERRLRQVAGHLSISPGDIQALVTEGIEGLLARKIPGYRPTPLPAPLPSVKPRKGSGPRVAVFLSRRQRVLDYLERYGSGSVVQISASLNLNPQTVNLLLRKMRTNGDVARERDRGSRAYIWFIKQ